jgi:hypothetical protein
MSIWARWFAVLPGAVLAAVLASFPLHFVLYATLTKVTEPYPALPERVLFPFVAAVAFVWTGTRIAPNHRSETSIVLFGLWLALWGAVLAFTLSGTQVGGRPFVLLGGAFGPIASFIGALVGLYLTRRQQARAASTA